MKLHSLGRLTDLMFAKFSGSIEDRGNYLVIKTPSNPYQAGSLALAEYPIDQLVMEADPGYHAARIYESVGFSSVETNYSLSWWKK